MLKTSEISKLSEKDLKTKVATLKAELFTNKFTKFTTGTEKPHVVKEVKKDIARLLTALNAKKTK
jgi:large subunit ribosomal protein L29